MSTSTEHGFPEIPGYTLESILGRGSMATVYRARQQGMNRAVAVKVLENAKLRFGGINITGHSDFLFFNSILPDSLYDLLILS